MRPETKEGVGDTTFLSNISYALSRADAVYGCQGYLSCIAVGLGGRLIGAAERTRGCLGIGGRERLIVDNGGRDPSTVVLMFGGSRSGISPRATIPGEILDGRPLKRVFSFRFRLMRTRQKATIKVARRIALPPADAAMMAGRVTWLSAGTVGDGGGILERTKTSRCGAVLRRHVRGNVHVLIM